MPELIDPWKTSPKRSYSVIENERFGLVYAKTVSIISGTGVTSALGTWYGDVVMGVLLSFDEAAIFYRDFNSHKSKIL